MSGSLTPELSPAQAESYTTPASSQERQGALRCGDPSPDNTTPNTMQNDNLLRAIQRQNELNAFRRYERRLRIAYAQSQNPHPPRWIDSDHSRRI